jgi:2,3-bisphosphoglycerate-independent phosphoglycerate mutase
MRMQEIVTMSTYKIGFPFKVAFPPQKMDNVLAEWLGKPGLEQNHIANSIVDGTRGLVTITG